MADEHSRTPASCLELSARTSATDHSNQPLQALAKNVFIRADIAPSALETLCLMVYILYLFTYLLTYLCTFNNAILIHITSCNVWYDRRNFMTPEARQCVNVASIVFCNLFSVIRN